MPIVQTAAGPRNLSGWRPDLPDHRDRFLPDRFGLARAAPSKADVLARMPPVYDQLQLGCHDDKTEVLTERGWVAWSAYNGSDLLATAHPATGLLEFQRPLAVQAYEYEGPMHFIEHRSLSFALTPNHRMLHRRWDEAARSLSAELTFRRIDEIGWYAGLPAAPAGSDSPRLEAITIGRRCYSGDDFVALMALLISDGWVGGTSENRNTVSFCCFREDRRATVRDFAARMGWHEIPGRPGVWRWSDAELAEWCRSNLYVGQVYRSPFKRIPAIVKGAAPEQIGLFLRFFGDQVGTDQSQFYSSSRHVIDDLQEMLLHVGRRAGIYDRPQRTSVMADGRHIEARPDARDITLTAWKKKHTLSVDRKDQIRVERYKGPVYCATVPNSTLITRRDGQVLVSGNSCTANMGCEVMEFLEKPGAPLSLFSRLYLYARTRLLEGTPLSDDAGAQIRTVFKALGRFGVCLESSWPYLDDGRQFARDPGPACDAEAAGHKAVFYYRCPSISQIRMSIVQGFPVGFGFAVPESMLGAAAATSGIVHLPGAGEAIVGGHAVSAVGYDDHVVIDGRAGGLLCRNSWGARWGLSGNFWLPYDYFHRALASDAWTLRRAQV